MDSLPSDSSEWEKGVVLMGNKKLGASQNTYTNKQLKLLNHGLDLPVILSMAPGVVSFSDAGNGVGYTGLRIRGTDASRILVTVNGIPINDAESQSVFWVNMPDILSSAEEVQVQRGVGATSTGVPTFGGGIHLTTLAPKRKAWGQMNSGVAYLLPEPKSFAPSYIKHRFTFRQTVGFGTGLLPKGWSLDGRFSYIKSDGAINNSGSQLQSYYIQLGRDAGKHRFRLIQFSGKERTGQAWNGVPFDSLYGYRTNRIHNDFTYKGQTDNYQQQHVQALYTYLHKPYLIFTFSAHGTFGKGYYEEYRNQDNIDRYGLLKTDTLITIKQMDIIRQRWLDNRYGGIISNIQYQKNKHLFTGGFSANIYEGTHFGEVIWSQYYGSNSFPHRYYEGKSQKKEWNIFVKHQWDINARNRFYWEFQSRNISYYLNGMDENSGVLFPYHFQTPYHFYMPRMGLSTRWSQSLRQSIFVGLASREPVRSDILLSGKNMPRPEHLLNMEYNLIFQNKKLLLTQTIYGMLYKDQLINDGSINDVGAYNRINLDKSFRIGWEGQVLAMLSKRISVEVNLAVSLNRAMSFTEFVDIYTDSTFTNGPGQTWKYTPLAFSPITVSGATLRWHPLKNLQVEGIVKFVSRQFLDNTGNKDRSLRAYMVSDIRVYWKMTEIWSISAWVNNVFNSVYSPNGYTWGYLYNGTRTQVNVAYPMSGTQCWLTVNAGF